MSADTSDARYSILYSTATKFVQSTVPIPSVSENQVLLSVRSPNCRVIYAPASYQNLVPSLKDPLDNEQHTFHMARVYPLLENVHIEVKDVMVDVAKQSAVVWALHCLTPKGRAEALNEIVWMLNMVDGGTKVEKAIAFVDTASSVVFFKDMGEVAREQGVGQK